MNNFNYRHERQNGMKHDGSNNHYVPGNKQFRKPFNNNNNNNRYNNNRYNNNNGDDNSIQHDAVSLETKQYLLKYVYNTIELSNYKYKLIEYEYDLPLLKEKQYYVSPNYNGIHSLLVFIKIKDQYLSFIIDRKTLTYNINQIDYDKVKVIPIHYRFDEEIYNGSIFDGVLLYNNIDGIKHFVINDIYCLRGKKQSDDKITNKMLNINTYLENIKDDPKTNNIVFIVNKLYELKDIQQLVNMYIPKSKYYKSIKGISFYTEFSGTKLIYLYNNCSLDKTQEGDKEKDSPNQATVTQNKFVTSATPVIPKEIKESNVEVNKESITATFRMKSTDTVDVYNLFIGEKLQEGDKKLFKYKKIGIGYIPNVACSQFCKDVFEQCNSDTILVECKYDNAKKKWIPFKLADQSKKRPDTLDKIKDYLN